MQVAALLQHLERRAQGVSARRAAHRHRLDGVDALAQATRPIRIAKRHASRDELPRGIGERMKHEIEEARSIRRASVLD